MSFDGRHISLVVNPSSGRGRAERLLPRVVDQLRAGLGDARVQVTRTTSYDDAVRRCRESVADGADALLVMGGDGMAHVGLNACAHTSTTLGVLPAGTGNDFCRGVGLPVRVGMAVDAVVRGRTRTIDLTDLARPDGSHEFVGSIVSTGYDARVNRRTNAVSSSFGPLSSMAYAGVALAELATFTPKHYRMVIDGEPHELDAMFVAIANAGYFGGGMAIAPHAVVDDGLLDLVIVQPVGRGVLMRLLPRVFRGGHVHHPQVRELRARHVTLDGDDMFVMGDGEELGGLPVELFSRAGALTVFGG